MITATEIAAKWGLRGGSGRWRGTCPVCSYPGALSLRELGGRPLSYCANGCTQEVLRDALSVVMDHTWSAPPQSARHKDIEASRRQRTEDALKIWSAAQAATGTPADAYLTRRGLPNLAESPSLRFLLNCRHLVSPSMYPTLVALVVNVDREPTGVHRTYLTPDGEKADVDPVKASKGLITGGAIRLDSEAPEICIGEGIESSASAGRLLKLPAWAAVSAGNLAQSLVLPPGVRSVVIAADADEAGTKAAGAAAIRWAAEGRRVRIAQPATPGCDFNDLLLASQRNASDAAPKFQ
jgi:putative DNA primase/helicase